MLLGGVMAATKNLPPMARPWAAATSKVSAQDMERNKEWFNIPMLSMPNNFFGPQGPADPSGLAYIKNSYQRTLAVLSRDHPDALQTATRLVFEAIWTNEKTRDAEGNVLITPELLRSICIEAGLSPDEADGALSRINDKATVDLLKSTVQEAVGRGAYGAPFFVCTVEGVPPQIFFGSDRFEVMAFTLGKPWYGPDPNRPTVAKL